MSSSCTPSQDCKSFGKTQKLWASLWVGLIAMVAFWIFAGILVRNCNVIWYGMAAGLLSFGLGFLVMLPWEKEKCSCTKLSSSEIVVSNE